MTEKADPINAMPTKAFFVTMLVRDISPERAILDLIDNCIDGAKRIRPDDNYSGLTVSIEIDATRLEIRDNCGGFDSETARDYAFRFGRPSAAGQTDFSIGQFGVGMKRALFKFGKEFSVSSKTLHEEWSMSVNAQQWANEHTPWHFEFKTIVDGLNNSPSECGTYLFKQRKYSRLTLMEERKSMLMTLINSHVTSALRVPSRTFSPLI